MTPIEFSVLGPLRVHAAGVLVELGPGRRRTTLAALIMDAPGVVPVDVLASRIWSRTRPDNPAAALHTYVSRLRSALRTRGEDGSQAATPILTDAPGYRLDIDPAAVDAVRFERLLERARRDRAGNPVRARDTVALALDLWRGQAYGDIQAPFAERESQRLGLLRVAAQELLVDCELALGRGAGLVDQIKALVSDEPLREPRHAALMLALYRSGRQAEALTHFESLRATLADELGIDPSRELQELHARILRQDAGLDLQARAAVDADPASPPHDIVHRPVDEVPALLPMVGRAAELAQLTASIRRAWEDERPVATAVVGEAGIGKSRLLDEAVRAMRSDRPLLAWGRCWQHDGAPTLWPWLQALRALVSQLDAPALTGALEGRGAAVVQLLPELGTTSGPARAPFTGAPAEGSIAGSQVRLFDAVTGFLERVAQDHQTLLLLEDMHWSDRPSRQLLEYLITHITGRGLALLVSVRVPTEDSSTPGQEILATLGRTGRADRVHLTGLCPEDVRRYVAARTGAQLDDPTARALVDRTEGNPFFVGELVSLLVDDTSEQDGADRLPAEVPDSVRDVVLRRLRRLGDAELDVLRSAAVLGRTFDLDLIRAISGAGDDLVDEALDRATEAGFICSEPNSDDQYRFTHAIVQQTLFEDTGPMRRRRLHGRIAEVLAAVEGTSLRHAERSIHHLALAGGEANIDSAVELCLDVASSASGRANYPEVELLLLRALDLTGRLRGPRAQQRELAVLVRLCALYDYFYGVLWPASVGYRERARHLIRSSASGRDVVGALNSAASSTLAVADFVSTDAIIQEMRLTADALDDDVLRACALLNSGLSQFQQGSFHQTIESLAAAQVLTDEFETEPWASVLLTPFEVVPGWRMLARMMRDGGDSTDPDAGPDDDLETMVGHCESRVPSIAAHAAGLLALRGVLLDDVRTTRHFAQRSVRVAEEAGNQSVAYYLTVVQAWATPDVTAAQLESVLSGLESPPRLLMRPFLRGLVADAHLRGGRPDRALVLHERSLAEARATRNDVYAPGPARRLAAITGP